MLQRQLVFKRGVRVNLITTVQTNLGIIQNAVKYHRQLDNEVLIASIVTVTHCYGFYSLLSSCFCLELYPHYRRGDKVDSDVRFE